MLTEHKSIIEDLIIGPTLEGDLAVVVSYAIDGRVDSYAKAGVPGSWLAALIGVVCEGAASVNHISGMLCRVRLDDKLCLAEVGRRDGSRWFVVREPEPPPLTTDAPWKGWTPNGERALRYLNKCRALAGMRDLDPVAAEYTDDDIIADARHYRSKSAPTESPTNSTRARRGATFEASVSSTTARSSRFPSADRGA